MEQAAHAPPVGRRRATQSEQQMHILLALPGIGHVTARAVCARFRSLHDLLNADAAATRDGPRRRALASRCTGTATCTSPCQPHTMCSHQKVQKTYERSLPTTCRRKNFHDQPRNASSFSLSTEAGNSISASSHKQEHIEWRTATLMTNTDNTSVALRADVMGILKDNELLLLESVQGKRVLRSLQLPTS